MEGSISWQSHWTPFASHVPLRVSSSQLCLAATISLENHENIWEYIGKYDKYWEMIGNIRNGPLIDDVIVALRVIFHGKLRASRPASGPSLVLSCCLLIWLVVQLPKNMCQEASSQLEHKNKVWNGLLHVNTCQTNITMENHHLSWENQL